MGSGGRVAVPYHRRWLPVKYAAAHRKESRDEPLCNILHNLCRRVCGILHLLVYRSSISTHRKTLWTSETAFCVSNRSQRRSNSRVKALKAFRCCRHLYRVHHVPLGSDQHKRLLSSPCFIHDIGKSRHCSKTSIFNPLSCCIFDLQLPPIGHLRAQVLESLIYIACRR